jgi:precorrin-2 dehydrogenase/sirohydrochlorin ferrochelatase
LDGDLEGCALVFCTALTEDLDAIAAAARALRVPLNITDRPALSSFIVPAVVRRGDLQVAISTGGASPALAGILRGELDEVYGPEYASLLDLLRSVRDHLRTSDRSASDRASLSRTLATDLRAAILQHDYAAVEEILARHLGIPLVALGVDRPAGR